MTGRCPVDPICPMVEGDGHVHVPRVVTGPDSGGNCGDPGSGIGCPVPNCTHGYSATPTVPGNTGLRDALRIHHPIMRSETGPFSGCRCGAVRLGQDVIAHVVAELSAALLAERDEAVRKVQAVRELLAHDPKLDSYIEQQFRRALGDTRTDGGGA